MGIARNSGLVLLVGLVTAGFVLWTSSRLDSATLTYPEGFAPQIDPHALRPRVPATSEFSPTLGAHPPHLATLSVPSVSAPSGSPSRPRIHFANFPDAPRSGQLQLMHLLAAADYAAVLSNGSLRRVAEALPEASDDSITDPLLPPYLPPNSDPDRPSSIHTSPPRAPPASLPPPLRVYGTSALRELVAQLQAVQRPLADPCGVPPLATVAGVGSRAARDRLAAIVARAALGRPIHVAVLGTSISAGKDCRTGQGCVWWFSVVSTLADLIARARASAAAPDCAASVAGKAKGLVSPSAAAPRSVERAPRGHSWSTYKAPIDASGGGGRVGGGGSGDLASGGSAGVGKDGPHVGGEAAGQAGGGSAAASGGVPLPWAGSEARVLFRRRAQGASAAGVGASGSGGGGGTASSVAGGGVVGSGAVGGIGGGERGVGAAFSGVAKENARKLARAVLRGQSDDTRQQQCRHTVNRCERLLRVPCGRWTHTNCLRRVVKNDSVPVTTLRGIYGLFKEPIVEAPQEEEPVTWERTAEGWGPRATCGSAGSQIQCCSVAGVDGVHTQGGALSVPVVVLGEESYGPRGIGRAYDTPQYSRPIWTDSNVTEQWRRRDEPRSSQPPGRVVSVQSVGRGFAAMECLYGGRGDSCACGSVCSSRRFGVGGLGNGDDGSEEGVGVANFDDPIMASGFGAANANSDGGCSINGRGCGGTAGCGGCEYVGVLVTDLARPASTPASWMLSLGSELNVSLTARSLPPVDIVLSEFVYVHGVHLSGSRDYFSSFYAAVRELSPDAAHLSLYPMAHAVSAIDLALEAADEAGEVLLIPPPKFNRIFPVAKRVSGLDALPQPTPFFPHFIHPNFRSHRCYAGLVTGVLFELALDAAGLTNAFGGREKSATFSSHPSETTFHEGVERWGASGSVRPTPQPPTAVQAKYLDGGKLCIKTEDEAPLISLHAFSPSWRAPKPGVEVVCSSRSVYGPDVAFKTGVQAWVKPFSEVGRNAFQAAVGAVEPGGKLPAVEAAVFYLNHISEYLSVQYMRGYSPRFIGSSADVELIYHPLLPKLRGRTRSITAQTLSTANADAFPELHEVWKEVVARNETLRGPRGDVDFPRGWYGCNRRDPTNIIVFDAVYISPSPSAHSLVPCHPTTLLALSKLNGGRGFVRETVGQLQGRNFQNATTFDVSRFKLPETIPAKAAVCVVVSSATTFKITALQGC